LRSGCARARAGIVAAFLTKTGSDVATLPGGGEPSAVKSACCCASVLALMGCGGLRRIIMTAVSLNVSPARKPRTGVALLVARDVRSVCSPAHRWVGRGDGAAMAAAATL